MNEWTELWDYILSEWNTWPPSRLLNSLDPFFQIRALTLPLCPLSNGALSPLTIVDDSDSDTVSDAPPLRSSSSHSSLIDVVDTDFDPSVEQNLIPPYPKKKDFDRYPLMESERKRAAKAVVATSVLDFTKKVLISLNLLCFSYLVFCPA